MEDQLPAGVTQVGAPNPVEGAANPAEQVQQPIQQQQSYEPEVSEGWNALEIAGAIVIGTVFCFMVYYYRYKTKVYPKDLAEIKSEISAVQSDVNSLANPNN
jgi:hypothetical protein